MGAVPMRKTKSLRHRRHRFLRSLFQEEKGLPPHVGTWHALVAGHGRFQGLQVTTVAKVAFSEGHRVRLCLQRSQHRNACIGPPHLDQRGRWHTTARRGRRLGMCKCSRLCGELSGHPWKHFVPSTQTLMAPSTVRNLKLVSRRSLRRAFRALALWPGCSTRRMPMSWASYRWDACVTYSVCTECARFVFCELKSRFSEAAHVTLVTRVSG